MKNFFLFLSICVCIFSRAQDTLILADQTRIISLVLLVTPDSIRYKPIENISGPDHYLAASQVKEIHYKNGSREMIVADLSGPKKMYDWGKHDAENSYRCKGCAASFIAVGLLIGPFAYIPAYSLAYIPPAEKNLAYPDEVLWKDLNYRKGYKDQTRRIKSRAIFSAVNISGWISLFVGAVVVGINDQSGK